MLSRASVGFLDWFSKQKIIPTERIRIETGCIFSPGLIYWNVIDWEEQTWSEVFKAAEKTDLYAGQIICWSKWDKEKYQASSSWREHWCSAWNSGKKEAASVEGVWKQVSENLGNATRSLQLFFSSADDASCRQRSSAWRQEAKLSFQMVTSGEKACLVFVCVCVRKGKETEYSCSKMLWHLWLLIGWYSSALQLEFPPSSSRYLLSLWCANG